MGGTHRTTFIGVVVGATLVAACTREPAGSGGEGNLMRRGALGADGPPQKALDAVTLGERMLAAKAVGDKGAYLAVLAELRDVPIQTMDEKFAEVAVGPSALTPDQWSAWRGIFESTDAALRLHWSPKALTPEVLLGWSPPLDAATPVAAWAELRAKHGATLDTLFGFGPADELMLADLAHSTEDVGDAPREPGYEHARLLFRRARGGYKVEGDHLAVDFVRPAGQEQWSLRALRGRWHRDLPALGFVPGAEASLAAHDVVVGHFAQKSEAVSFTSEEPVFLTSTGAPGFYYALGVQGPEGPYMAYVDAATNELVHLHRQWDDDTVAASVKSEVGLPYDGNKDAGGSTGKRERAISNATIYEDEEGVVDGSTAWTQGDPLTELGATGSTGGAYSIEYSGSDTDWVVDMRGTWSHDESQKCKVITYPLGNSSYSCTDDLTYGFTAGTDFTQAKTETDHKTRRSETYYHMDYIARVFAHASVGNPGYSSLDFVYAQYGASGAQSPADSLAGISGAAHPTQFPGGPGIRIRAREDMDDIAHIDAERRFRGAIYHEVGHTHRYKAAETSCGPGSITDMKCLCRAWEEGRADIPKIAGTRFENVRPEYRPYLQYPADYTDSDDCYDEGIYERSRFFEALYGEYMLRAGHTRALSHIYDSSYLAGVDTETAMVCWDANNNVGPCTGSMSTMPGNSHYVKMLAASTAKSVAAAEMGAEISAVFHRRANDGDGSVAGTQTYPWYDDIPNSYPYGILVPATEFEGVGEYTTGPDATGGGSGTLRLDYGGGGPGYQGDYDSFQFLARADETVRVETYNLGGSADTILEILDLSGNVLATNDDCSTSVCGWCRTGSDALHSCYDFTPSTTKVYVARVRAYSSSTLGTYNLRLEAEGDAVGDAKAASNPTPAAGNIPQVIDTNTDQDWFHVYAAGDFSVKACTTTGSLTPTITVYDAADTQLLNRTMGSCGSTSMEPVTVSAPGMFWIKVASRNAASSGPYELHVTNTGTDQDTDSTYGNAIPVTVDSGKGLALGLYMNSSSDKDWIKLEAVAGYVYNVATFIEQGVSVDTVLEVYAPTHVGMTGTGAATAYENSTMFKRILCDWEDDANCHADLGHWMLQDSNGALQGSASSVTFSAPVTGTYHVLVGQRPGSGTTGRYGLTVSRSQAAHTTFLAFP